jgi:hypothetical protein
MPSISNIDYSKGIIKPPPQILPTNRTSLVQVNDLMSRSFNDNFYYYRCRNCDTNLTTNTPSSQYQKQKIIQRTVRVDSSQYTMNLASLAGYQNPNKKNAYVPWNQMSDRAEPAKQKANANGGNTIGSSSTRHSITRLRPGAMSPGGVGCDIKHNSYDRYLNRLKGKAPLRRGVVPSNFGVEEIPFNRAFPIYGDKVVKTSIVSGCNCPIFPSKRNSEDYRKLYENNENQNYDFNVPYVFSVGQNIFILKNGHEAFATILEDLGNGNFKIETFNGEILITNQSNFIIYNPCESEKINYQKVNPGGSFVNQYIVDPGTIVDCKNVDGTISNITNTMSFFPELNNTTPNNNLFQDNGIRYTNGIPIQVNL